jgi:hypothetical protein
MANSIGWGDGSVNNTIGWGQGAVNNSIGWGSAQFTSYSGETNIIGNLVTVLINAFKIRVATDSGTYSADACQISTLTALNNI